MNHYNDDNKLPLTTYSFVSMVVCYRGDNAVIQETSYNHLTDYMQSSVKESSYTQFSLIIDMAILHM